MSLKERIEAIPGSDGFYKSRTADTFLGAANELRDVGMKEDDVIDLLTNLYHAVAGEFGA